jgi:hypothetical protein
MAFIRLGESGRRILISFTAPAYGIFEYNEDGFPLWIADEEKQTHFKFHEMVTPSEVEKAIVFGMQKSEETHDIRPRITLGCKADIMQRVLNEGE